MRPCFATNNVPAGSRFPQSSTANWLLSQPGAYESNGGSARVVPTTQVLRHARELGVSSDGLKARVREAEEEDTPISIKALSDSPENSE